MRATAAAVRWGSQPGGITLVDPETATLGIEVAMGLGHVPTLAEAIRIATAELDRFEDGQTERTVGVDPDGTGDVPLVDYGLGDLATVDGDDFPVIVLTVAEDKDRPGRLIYIPQIGDVVDPQNLRMARGAKKMTNGTGGGAFRSATPLSMPGRPATILRPGGGCSCVAAYVESDQFDFTGNGSAVNITIEFNDPAPVNPYFYEGCTPEAGGLRVSSAGTYTVVVHVDLTTGDLDVAPATVGYGMTGPGYDARFDWLQNGATGAARVIQSNTDIVRVAANTLIGANLNVRNTPGNGSAAFASDWGVQGFAYLQLVHHCGCSTPPA